MLAIHPLLRALLKVYFLFCISHFSRKWKIGIFSFWHCLNCDIHNGREAWFCKVIFLETRSKYRLIRRIPWVSLSQTPFQGSCFRHSRWCPHRRLQKPSYGPEIAFHFAILTCSRLETLFWRPWFLLKPIQKKAFFYLTSWNSTALGKKSLVPHT